MSSAGSGPTFGENPEARDALRALAGVAMCPRCDAQVIRVVAARSNVWVLPCAHAIPREQHAEFMRHYPSPGAWQGPIPPEPVRNPCPVCAREVQALVDREDNPDGIVLDLQSRWPKIVGSIVGRFRAWPCRHALTPDQFQKIIYPER